ncbi:MAG: DUF3368 domain-containing protein [Spirochaetales bacterium]|nr:DUF3368 domain-containing protein [Spirochaetales bacterium]
MIYVCNTTPIIAFSKIGYIELIREVFGTIIVPEAVFKELTEYGQERPGANEILNADWVTIEKVKNKEYVDFLKTSLDNGEAEVIALAYEKKAFLAIIDEKIARRIAMQMGINIIGSIGILLKAKKQGIIKEIKPYWDNMIRCGIRYNKKFYSELLKRTQES